MNSNEITMVMLRKGKRSILVASVYVPCYGQREQSDEQELLDRLQEIQEATRREREKVPETEMFIAGDFKRHDSLWGGETGLRLKQDKASAVRY
jgi:hypothetical protein